MRGLPCALEMHSWITSWSLPSNSCSLPKDYLCRVNDPASKINVPLPMKYVLFSKFSSSQFSSVQLLSCVQPFATPWTVAHQASLSITSSRGLLKLMSIELVMPSIHLILCRPLLLLPSIFPSIRVFSNESALRIRWPKYWSSSFNISPSNEYTGLISFRMDWLDLPDVQGTLKNLLQTTVQKHQFIGIHPSLCFNSHIHTWPLEKPEPWLDRPLLAKWCLWFLICCLGWS